MRISELIERLGRTVFEAPFGATAQTSDSPEVAEIRFAIFDEIKKKTQRAGGKELFPYNLVRIHIRGVGDAESSIFERDFFRGFFEQEVRANLAKSACRFPQDLRVEVLVTTTLPKDNNQWLWIETLSEERKVEPPVDPRARKVARLTVMSGAANKPEIALQKARTNIGRVVDVYKSEGLARRNDLVFSEDTPVNRTVSREHAHVEYDQTNDEYRLFNDRWYKRGNKTEANCGLWIVRDGAGQEVHRDTRGAKLLHGDEIHFGKAVVKFQIK